MTENELFGNSEQLNDTISRQAAINALMEIMDRPNHAEFLYTDEICKTLNELPSAEPEQPPYVAEIETEYQKAVNMPYIKKPLAKALYEVWKKHDREDAERRTDE